MYRNINHSINRPDSTISIALLYKAFRKAINYEKYVKGGKKL